MSSRYSHFSIRNEIASTLFCNYGDIVKFTLVILSLYKKFIQFMFFVLMCLKL